jgi:hypothetical protein
MSAVRTSVVSTGTLQFVFWGSIQLGMAGRYKQDLPNGATFYFYEG